jgi:hypothetical protein
VSMWDGIFWFYMKCYCRTLLTYAMFGFWLIWCLKIVNIQDLRHDKWRWIESGGVIFPRWRKIDVVRYKNNDILYKLCHIKFDKCNMICIVDRHCSIMHNMLLVIINISSMKMTFVNLNFSMTFPRQVESQVFNLKYNINQKQVGMKGAKNKYWTCPLVQANI